MAHHFRPEINPPQRFGTGRTGPDVTTLMWDGQLAFPYKITIPSRICHTHLQRWYKTDSRSGSATMTEDKTFPVLTEIEQMRWDAACSGIGALGNEAAQGTISEETIEGTFNQLGQLQIDIPKVINSIHIPKHAGQYEAALIAILKRIPDGWGRWISCDPGWYPIIVDLDAALASLCPDYVVLQIKEKYGTLRYYAEPPSYPDPACDIAFEAEHPRPEFHGPDWQAWVDLWDAHCETEEHDAGFAAVYEPWVVMRDALEPQFDELINAAEKKSAITCELCGQPGTIRSRYGWCKTLCTTCAERGGWL